MTPVVNAGRSLLVVVAVGAENAVRDSGSDLPLVIALGVITCLTLLVGVVRYKVTKWALDGSTLRIETGLFKRDARQLPLTRVQAVDVVRPFLARALGLAELRIRLAGGGRAGGKLAYLSEPVAVDLRARILAGHHGLDQATPEPTPQAMATVPTRQLVISAVLSSATGLAFGWLVIFVIIIVGAGSSSAAPTTAGVGTLLLSLYGFVRNTWRRVTSQYGFSVGLAPDGIRIHRGLLSTVSETVPFARVQAVRKIQPLVWRMFDWCRLEVDVAGASGEERGSRSSSVTKALLPVGRTEVADALFSSLLGLRQFPLAKPPERARWKALLSYHFLSAASDGAVVAATTGRFRKVTIWIPLEKAQSIRWAEGPVQRPFGLATVYVDAAGRRATAELRDRGTEEAAALFHQLVLDSRAARQRADHRSPPPVPSLPLPSPSLPSPSVPSPAAPVLTPPGAAVVSMGQPGPPPAANGRTRGPTNGGPGDS